MGRLRSRSRSTDRGRWGDPETSHSHLHSTFRHDGCSRSRSRDRKEPRRHDRTRGESRSRSRSRSRRGTARDHDYGRHQDRHRPRGRDRDGDRRTGGDQDAFPNSALEAREYDYQHRHDRDGGGDRGPPPVYRERERGSDQAWDLHRHRDRDRRTERGRSDRWGSPRRGTADADGNATASGHGGGAGGDLGGDPRRPHWRSSSPPHQHSQGGGGDSSWDRRRERGNGEAWSNPPPPSLPTGAAPPRAPPLSSAPPPMGSVHRGSVHTIRPFGIFVMLPGYRRHVMVHNTQVSDELRFTREDDEDAKTKAMEFYYPVGEQVWVKITEVAPDDRHPEELRVNGSLRSVDQITGADLDPEGAMAAEQQQHLGGAIRGRGGPETDEPPEVGSVHRATVKRIEAYGVFVALEGFRRHGLVHTSQVSNFLNFTREDTDEQKKAELSGVVAVGDHIWVKVVEVAPDEARGGFKIGCSIKLVNPANGDDLDPANTRYRPRDSAAGRGLGGPPAAIGAGAGDVGRGGKIDWGHLAADTKLYVNEKAAAQYKLLDEEAPPQQQQRPPLPGPPGARLPGPPGAPVPGVGGGAGRPGMPPSGPMGRGRSVVLPAWMTQGAGAGGALGGGGGPPAPGSYPESQQQLLPPPPAGNQLPSSSKFELVGGRDRDVDPSTFLLDLIGGGGTGGGGGGTRISSIEEALAILEAHGHSSKRSKKDKKDKGKGKGKGKDKKEKKKKEKSKKSLSVRRWSGNGSSSSKSEEDVDLERGQRR